MTQPFDNDLFAFVNPGGQIVLQVQFETFIGSGLAQPVAGVQVTITPAAGGAATIGPVTPQAITQAQYAYTWIVPQTQAPGDYVAVFTGTGTQGLITLPVTVRVVEPPAQTPGPGVYATVADYRAWSGDLITPATRVGIAARRCSEILDLYLIGAVYATDPDSMPTDADVRDAFQRATCAQIQFWLANNDPAGVKSQFASTSMGGVSLVRTQRAQGQVLPPLAPQAAAILQTAGVLATAPLINW